MNLEKNHFFFKYKKMNETGNVRVWYWVKKVHEVRTCVSGVRPKGLTIIRLLFLASTSPFPIWFYKNESLLTK